MASEVTGELVRCNRVWFFWRNLGVAELLANSICATGQTRLSLYGKSESSPEMFFLLTTTFCLTNSSILFIILVLLTFEASSLEMLSYIASAPGHCLSTNLMQSMAANFLG